MKELSILHFLVLFALGALGTKALADWLGKSPENSWYVTGAVVVGLAALHLQRSDRQFLKVISERPFLIYLAEYSVLILPIIALFLVTGYYLPLPLLGVGIVGISAFTQEIRSISSNDWSINSLLPVTNFEWMAGIRQSRATLLVLYVAGLALSSFPYLSLLVCLLLVVSITTFYARGESLALLSLPEKAPSQFLKSKLKSHLGIFYVFVMPLCLVYGVQHAATWYITLAFCLLIGIVLAFCILLKYAVYRPNEDLSAGTSLNALAIASVLIPFLLPVPAIMCFRNYQKAIRNLTPYLDDYR